MTKLETTINTVMQRLKPEIASTTWESRRRYFKQMTILAEQLNIEEPCNELYAAFIADDNGSKERRALHNRCAKLIDAIAGTRGMDSKGILLNEQPLPPEVEVNEFFSHMSFPITTIVSLDYLIVKASIEMRYLNLTNSTFGQYRHSWIDIRRYFHIAGRNEYNAAFMQNYIQEISNRRNNGSMKEWKWKINRKAAHVLIEVANTGCFHWDIIHKKINNKNLEVEIIRLKNIDLLRQKNLSKSTIDLYDYVFRKAMECAGIKTAKELQLLAPENVQLIIGKLSEICNRRSMSTILPILRKTLKTLHENNYISKNLSGMVMNGFAQRGSVAAYISEKDQADLITQLDKESKRTKAIILLALRLGLRDCDICNLTFQEIDWQKDKIRLVQKKTGQPLILPLLPDVGNALMDYILNERPQNNSRYPYVFLRKQAPYHKLSAVYSICSRLLIQLGINPVNGATTGVHLFRYSLAYKLLVAKVPHQVITDTLGHVSKESDKPYLSMNESMLRLCSLDLSVIDRITWNGSEFQ
jgi:integrase